MIWIWCSPGRPVSCQSAPPRPRLHQALVHELARLASIEHGAGRQRPGTPDRAGLRRAARAGPAPSRRRQDATVGPDEPTNSAWANQPPPAPPRGKRAGQGTDPWPPAPTSEGSLPRVTSPVHSGRAAGYKDGRGESILGWFNHTPGDHRERRHRWRHHETSPLGPSCRHILVRGGGLWTGAASWPGCHGEDSVTVLPDASPGGAR